MSTYKIIRFYQREDMPHEVIAEGLTLQQAQQHCHDQESSSATAAERDNILRTRQYGEWFDGYRIEPETDS
jgi:hypothetical protein